MKTIDKAADDVFNSRMDISDELSKSYSLKEVALAEKQCFKAGVEFAQRWIPVDEELPDEFPVDIIATDGERYKAFCIENEASINFLTNCFTHWRPINFK